MGFLAKILRFFIIPFTVVLLTHSAATATTCTSSTEYTSCAAGYYMNKTGAGNSCLLCPLGCTCAGGTAAPVCTITYNLNGGSGTTPSSKSCTRNTSCSLQSGATTSFYRAGYVFKGWNTSSSATSGTTSITPLAGTTVYAIWDSCDSGTYKGGSGTQASAACSSCPSLSLLPPGTNWNWYSMNAATSVSQCQASYFGPNCDSCDMYATAASASAWNDPTGTCYPFDLATFNGTRCVCKACSGNTGANCSLTTNDPGSNQCGYTTSCKTGYNSITNNGKYNAKCSVISYTITYNLNGGSHSGQKTSYTIETATFNLTTPTRANSTFGGWYTESSFTNKLTQIVKGSTGNKTLYAKWTCNTGYTASGNSCVQLCTSKTNTTSTQTCSHTGSISNGTATYSNGKQTCNGYYTSSGTSSCSGCSNWGTCSGGTTISSVTCNSGYHADGNTCISNTQTCSSTYGGLTGASGNITWNGSGWNKSACYKDNLAYTATHGSGTQTCYYTSGTGSTATYSSSCKNKIITSCAAGYYRASTSATDCSVVDYGYWSANGSVGRTACTTLGTGYTTDTTTASSNTQCYLSMSQGYVRSGTSGTTTTKCLAGTYKAAHKAYYGNTYTCGTCQTREYYSGDGAGSCSYIDNGYYTTGCDANGDKCTGQSMCTSGTWCSRGVAYNCSSLTGVPVSGGTYSSADASDSNTDCRYTPPAPALPTNCETITMSDETLSYTGTAWPELYYSVTAIPGAYILNNDTLRPRCYICGNGKYSSGWYTESCGDCTNAPDNASYTGHGTGNASSCPWQCNRGYFPSYISTNATAADYAADGHYCPACPAGYVCTGTSAPIANAVTITFYPNKLSGNTQTSSELCLKNVECELPSALFDSTGYTFLGWSETIDGEPLTKITPTTNSLTLYAIATPKQYTVTLDKNDGTGTQANIDVTYGTNMDSIVPPTRPGYIFQGYYSDTSYTTQYFDETGKCTKTYYIADDTTLWAKWKIEIFYVTLSSNNGDSNATPSGIYKQTGDGNWYTNSDATTVIESLTTLPTRTGYNFMGYYTKYTDGTQCIDKTGALNKSCNFTKNTYLYAQWNAKTITIKLDDDGGSGGTGTITVVYDGELPESVNVPTKTGYTFNGYYSAKTNGTQYYYQYGNRAYFNKWSNSAANVTFFAQWIPNTYPVTYQGYYSSSVAYGSEYTVPEPLEKNGYTFNGWLRQDTQDIYWPGDVLTLDETNAITYIPQWDAIDYTITYTTDFNNKTQTYTQTVHYGESFTTAPEDIFQMPSSACRVRFWDKTDGGSFGSPNSSQTYYNTSNTTVVADIVCDTELNFNGGALSGTDGTEFYTADTVPMSAYYPSDDYDWAGYYINYLNEIISAPPADGIGYWYENDGYILSSWNTMSDGSGTSDSAQCVIPDCLAMYAIWDECGVGYYCTRGVKTTCTNAPTTGAIYTNTTASDANCPWTCIENYYRAISATNDTYSPTGATCAPCPVGFACPGGDTEPVQMYIDLKYDLAGGINVSLNTTFTCPLGVDCALNANTGVDFYKSGHVFRGWSPDKNATNGVATLRATDLPDLNKQTLYAIWDSCDECTVGPDAYCEMSVQNNICVYSTGCNDGYGNLTGNGTATPKCSSLGYVITYASGFDDTTITQPVSYAATFTTRGEDAFTRHGYIFAGWSGTYPAPDTEYTYDILGGTVLTAQWRPIERDCAAGEYMPWWNGDTECAPCDAGFYCPGGKNIFDSGNIDVANSANITPIKTCPPPSDKTWTVSSTEFAATYHDCFETRMPDNCDGGTIRHIGNSPTTYSPTSVADKSLSALFGFYVNDEQTECAPCPDGYVCIGGTSAPELIRDAVISCTAPNATDATQTWNPAKKEYGPCTIIECDTDYHLIDNRCEYDFNECVVTNGTGVHEWNHITRKWSECTATECDAGYMIDGGRNAQCVPCDNADGVLQWGTGECEIKKCEYQDKKYALDGNVCIPICEDESDETGSKHWNGTECVITCETGYSNWDD